jgi:hypothetical protein
MEEEPPYTINGQIITILRSMNLSLISPPVDFTTYSFVITTGATLDISGNDLTIIDLSGLGNIGLGNQTLTITNAVSTFSGVISGVKANLYEDSLKLLGGTLTLSGEKNTYTGQTKIVAPGKLIVTNSKSLGTGQILSDGGNLLVTDTFTIGNPFGTFSTTNLATKISAATGKTVTFTDVFGRTPIIIGDADNKGTVIFSNQYNGPVDFSINSNATNMTYGTESLPTFNYTSNFTNGTDTLTTGALTSAAPVYNSGSNTKTGNVGDTYPITIGTLVPANFRYTFTYTGNSLTIVKALLDITASPQSTTYTVTFPLEQNAYTVSTLVNGDTFSITGVILKYNNSTTVPPTTPHGTYDIVPSNANGTGLTNYTVIYIVGILTIAQLPATTVPANTTVSDGTLNNYKDVKLDGNTTVLATATSSLDTTVTNTETMTFTESNNFKASVNGGEIAIDDGVVLVMTGKVEIDKLTLGANSKVELAGNNKVSDTIVLSDGSQLLASGDKTDIPAAVSGTGDFKAISGVTTLGIDNPGYTGLMSVASGAALSVASSDSLGSSSGIYLDGLLNLNDVTPQNKIPIFAGSGGIMKAGQNNQ